MSLFVKDGGGAAKQEKTVTAGTSITEAFRQILFRGR